MLLIAASVPNAWCQTVRKLVVNSERGCNAASHIGLQCSQVRRGRPVSSFTTLSFSGDHVTGGARSSINFAQNWTVAPFRDSSGTLQLGDSLFVHSDTALVPNRVRPTESSEYHPVQVEFSLDAPVFARRLERIAEIPYAQYFDTKTAADLGEFTDATARAVFQDDAQYSLFVNGSTGPNATCSGEPVTFRDLIGTECSRLMGLGRSDNYFAPTNRNANDVRVQGASVRDAWDNAQFMTINTAESSGECAAALCYPCGAASVDAVTLVRSLPVGPVCHVWHAVDKPVVALSGNATLRFNVTSANGTVEQREYTLPVSSLANSEALDAEFSFSALLRARVNRTGIERPVVSDTRADGVYVVCDTPTLSGKIDMGARNPFHPRGLDPVRGIYTSAPSYRAPFYYMDAATALRYYGDDGLCKISEHNTPSRFLYSHAPRVQSLCAAAGDANLVRGGGVAGFEQCSSASFGESTPAHIFAALSQWTAQYGLLVDPAERAAFVRNERHPQISPLWNPEAPNMWLHTPAASAALDRMRNLNSGAPATRQDMYIMLEPRRQRRVAVDWALDLHVHEGLVEVIEPDERETFPDALLRRANGTLFSNTTNDAQLTSAPVVLAGLSGCRYGGLRLEQYGITGVDKNGKPISESDSDDERLFGFSLAVAICNARARNVTYFVESNCTSLVSKAVGGDEFFYHSELVTIARRGAPAPNSASNCFTYTTPFYGANRTQLHDLVKSRGGVNKTTEHVTLGSCELTVSAPDADVVYEPSIRPPSASLIELFAALNHTVVEPATVAGHPDTLAFTCALDARTIEMARDNALHDEDEEKLEARLQVLGLLCIILAVSLLLMFFLFLCWCCISSDSEPAPAPQRAKKPKIE